MKVGDLVKMKYDMWWKVRNRRKDFTADVGIVYGIAAKGLKVLLPDGKIQVGLIEEWEVVGKSQ